MIAFALALVAALGCPTGDLAQGRPATGDGILRGEVAWLTSPGTPQEGTVWDDDGAAVISPSGHAVVDLGELRTLGALELQADNDDEYMVEYSTDNLHWTPLWLVPPEPSGIGLRTRRHRIGDPVIVRQLRVFGRNGDGNYSVSRLRAFCRVESNWGKGPGLLEPMALWRSMDNDSMLRIKGSIALLGALLLLAGLLLERFKREKLLRRTRDALLGLLALISFCGWFNLFHFHFDGFVHDWEFFHYYVGAKYFPELGYTRLYECATAAELERFGHDALRGRTIRNLVSNDLESAQPILDNPELCTDHFSRERWRSFVADTMYFRSRFSAKKWEGVIHDHGYNATPVWGLFGRLLANTAPASWTQVLHLAWLDPAMLVLMWCFAIWAFGWRPAAVAMIWWGTNLPARFWWNGGAYLRMDWLACSIIGICLVKKEHRASGGFLLTTGALLRVFPGFIVVGLLCKAVVEFWRTRKLSFQSQRFALGCIAALVILVPASIMTSGFDSYGGFAANSKKHLDTPLTNNMGLKTVIAFSGNTRTNDLVNSSADPFGAWKEARRRLFRERKLLFYAGLLAFVGLLAWAVRDQPDWVALALGIGLIPFASELTCYYYSIYLGLGFLWQRWKPIGVLLCFLSALTCHLALAYPAEDQHFLRISIGVLLLAVVSAVLVGRDRRSSSAAA